MDPESAGGLQNARQLAIRFSRSSLIANTCSPALLEMQDGLAVSLLTGPASPSRTLPARTAEELSAQAARSPATTRRRARSLRDPGVERAAGEAGDHAKRSKTSTLSVEHLLLASRSRSTPVRPPAGRRGPVDHPQVLAALKEVRANPARHHRQPRRPVRARLKKYCKRSRGAWPSLANSTPVIGP
jgi:ATP-dependent Clp protease ATP-binding subunit ClpA